MTATGPKEVWLSWTESSPRLLQWTEGRWSASPVPTPKGTDGLGPALLASARGQVIAGVFSGGEDGTSALHVARQRDGAWVWLGEPLISRKRPFTHVVQASIAFGQDGAPIVAWSEERNVTLTGLFVSRWDGASWERLGELSPGGSDYYLSPTVAVGRRGEIWLAWVEGQPAAVRVARWDGAKWSDVGRQELEEIVGDKTSPQHPRLHVEPQGGAWLLWRASQRGGGTLSLARWDGTRWSSMAPPRARNGDAATVWSADMIHGPNGVLVAWSQSSETENHHLYAAEWVSDRWIERLAGLHLAAGVSNVSDVGLARGDQDSFFVAWDEGGDDGRRTRLVQAYACTAGESPVTPPPSVVERDTWPPTVEEAARRIAASLDDQSKARVRSTKKRDLILLHHGLGTVIRNSLGLWRGNDRLLGSCGHGKPVHPDECSMVIIEAVWALLQDGAAGELAPAERS